MPPLPPPLAPSGDLSRTTPDVILRWCELVRFTGTLAFTSGARRGVLPMLAGVPEVPDGDARLLSAFEEFSDLSAGRYTLTQLLPPLEGATPMSDLVVRGSLEKSPVSELLRYSEGAGLTGKLSLHAADGRSCVARYRRGELESITVDEKADADLSDVFAWSRGTFIVQAVSVFEAERPATAPNVGDGFLQTLEVALTDLVARSERVAETTRKRPPSVNNPPSMLRNTTLPFGVQGEGTTAPATPAAPATVSEPGTARRSLPPPPPPPPPHDGTVKVYIVPREAVTGPSVTQHASAKLGSEVVPLDPLSVKATAVKDPAAVLAARPAPKPAVEPKPAVDAEATVPKPEPTKPETTKPETTKPENVKPETALAAPSATKPATSDKGWTDAPVTRSTEPEFVAERTSLVPDLEPLPDSASGSFTAVTGTATPLPDQPAIPAKTATPSPSEPARATPAMTPTAASIPLTALFGTTLALGLGAAVYILVGLLR